jgi:hypothetical protein
MIGRRLKIPQPGEVAANIRALLRRPCSCFGKDQATKLVNEQEVIETGGDVHISTANHTDLVSASRLVALFGLTRGRCKQQEQQPSSSNHNLVARVSTAERINPAPQDSPSQERTSNGNGYFSSNPLERVPSPDPIVPRSPRKRAVLVCAQSSSFVLIR